jgi:hypothetical protein
LACLVGRIFLWLFAFFVAILFSPGWNNGTRSFFLIDFRAGAVMIREPFGNW